MCFRYNGIFSQRENLQFCELMKASQPEWVFIDEEAFGEGWETWKFEVELSANAQARAMPGEKPLDLAWRMAASESGRPSGPKLSSCLRRARHTARVGNESREGQLGGDQA